MTSFDFGDRSISWEQRSFYKPIAADQSPHEVLFYGDKGTLGVSRTKWALYDPSDST